METVDESLRAAPEPQRTTLRALRATLRELLPDADEVRSYGVPAFVVGGRPGGRLRLGQAHCSYYPHSGAVLSELDDELEGYDRSKGTLRFPIDAPPSRHLTARLVEVKLAHLRSPT